MLGMSSPRLTEQAPLADRTMVPTHVVLQDPLSARAFPPRTLATLTSTQLRICRVHASPAVKLHAVPSSKQMRKHQKIRNAASASHHHAAIARA